MPYVIRNTLVLAGLLVIILLVSFINNAMTNKKIEAIKTTYTQNQQMLENLKRTNPDLANEAQIVASLEETRQRARDNNKLFIKEDNPTITFQYLIDICDVFCPDVEFNFIIKGSGLTPNNVNYNTYQINGTALLNSLHFFIFQLEYQSPLITIEDIRLSEDDIGSNDQIAFSLQMNVYYDPQNGIDINEIKTRRFTFANLKYNPFRSRIYQAQDDKEAHLVNVYNVTLIGLTPEKAFLRTDTGRIITLGSGDKVKFGYVNYIDWKKQCIAFKINRIGIKEDYILYLDKFKQEETEQYRYSNKDRL
jgi:hypothetical protein